jgi:hypothetical protein
VSGAAPLRAHAEALRGWSLPPGDPGVPQLRDLLRPDVMTPALERSLRPGFDVEDLRVRMVDYRPGAGATVAYDVSVAGARRVAVATAGAALCPAAARTDARRAIAHALGAESPVARPLTYDVGLGALVQWYPLDLAMPALARPVGEVLRLAARAGIAVDPEAGPAETLLYRPGQRAVLRAGDVVLKAYAGDAEFRAGVDGLRIAGGLGLAAAPRLRGALEGVVETHDCGTLDAAVAAARAAAAAGDVVLLSPACASYDQFENFERRGEEFSRLVQNLGG